jgi:hypothetical protein
MLIGDSIGGLTEIQCGEQSVRTALTSQNLVRALLSKSDHTSDEFIPFEVLNKFLHDPLLHILHSGGLNGDDSWSLQRLRNQSDLHRPLGSGFEESNTLGNSGIRKLR